MEEGWEQVWVLGWFSEQWGSARSWRTRLTSQMTTRKFQRYMQLRERKVAGADAPDGTLFFAG